MDNYLSQEGIHGEEDKANDVIFFSFKKVEILNPMARLRQLDLNYVLYRLYLRTTHTLLCDLV